MTDERVLKFPAGAACFTIAGSHKGYIARAELIPGHGKLAVRLFSGRIMPELTLYLEANAAAEFGAGVAIGALRAAGAGPPEQQEADENDSER